MRRLAERIPKPLRSDSAFIILCLLVGLALRALHLEDFANSPLLQFPLGPDVSEYDDWAKAILVGQSLPEKLPIHAPLYPHFLAALYKLTGGDMLLVRLFQTTLGLLAGIPLFLMLRDATAQCKGAMKVAPRVFLLLWAVFPLEIQYQSELYCESLLLPLLVLSAWLLHEAEKRETAVWKLSFAAGGGLAGGLAVVTHPMAALFLGIEFLWLLFSALRKVSVARALAPVALLLLLALPVAPVCLFNAKLKDGAPVVQGNGGFNFFLGNNPNADGTCYLRPGPEWDACHAEAAAEAEAMESSKDSVFLARASYWIASQPFDWLALTAKKALYAINFRELPTASDFSLCADASFIQRNFLGLFGPFAVFALLGLWLELRKKDRGALPGLKHVLFLALAFWAAQTLFVAGGRYRMLMHPALIALACCALLSLPEALRSWKRALEILAVSTLASLAVYAPRPPLNIPKLRAEAESSLAEAQLLSGRPDDALKTIDASAKELGSWDRTWNVRCRILLTLGRMKEAEQCLLETAVRFPKSHYAFMNLGALASDRGDFVSATNFFNQALARRNDDPDLLYNYALEQQRKGDVKKAEALYNECLELKPSHAKALNNFGALLLAANRPKEAEPILLKAVLLDPLNSGPLVNLAVAKLQLGDNEKAEKLAFEALALNKHDQRAVELLKMLGVKP